MYIFIFYAIIFIFIIVYCCISHFVKVQIGKPPIGNLIIAYNYSYLSSIKKFNPFNDSILDCNKNKWIKLCYFGPWVKHIEVAQGLILNESGVSPDDQLLKTVKSKGLSLFMTPAIAHAVYMVFPALPFLSLTKIFAILVGYPKIRHYSDVLNHIFLKYLFAEKHNLCGYPILEVYSKNSLAIILPLIRQDEFVVPEADKIVYGQVYTKTVRTKKNFNGKHLPVSMPLPKVLAKLVKTAKAVKRKTKG